jgi:carbamoyltransferase
MNLVGFGLTAHDSSIAAYKEGKFLYRKAERQFNQKHAHGDTDWALSVLKEWDITKYELAESVLLSGKNPQKIKEGNKLDHHYSHLLSSSRQLDVHLVLDGFAFGPADNIMSSQPYTGLFKVANRQAERMFEFATVPVLLNTCIDSKEFSHYEDFRMDQETFFNFLRDLKNNGKHEDFYKLVQYVDFPGKVMSLQSYGKPNYKQIEEWLRLGQYRNKTVKDEVMSTSWDLNKIATLHKFCEEITLQKVQGFPGEFSYSGGIAQNVVINRAMLDAHLNPHIDPWAYDGGCSIGALNFLLDKHNIERYADWVQDDEAPDDGPDGPTLAEVAALIAQNKIVGWYQGNGEVGPRALGRRSILFNPANEKAKDKVNKIKQREWWRPFGASVLEDKANQFFDIPISRHMLFNSKVLYSGIPGVTHVDGTCRHQTVPNEDSPIQWLLTYLELETGLPIVLNTSLNMKGKPICSTVKEAINIFKSTDMDAICIGDKLYKK